MSSLTQITLGQPPKEFWGQFVAICGWRVVLGLHQNSLTHSPPHNPPPPGITLGGDEIPLNPQVGPARVFRVVKASPRGECSPRDPMWVTQTTWTTQCCWWAMARKRGGRSGG